MTPAPNARRPGSSGQPPASARQVALERFWAGVVPDLAARVPLFGTVRPWGYPFLKKTSGGITFRLNAKLDHTSVWLQVHRSTVAESEAVYQRLILNRDAVRLALPEEMGWDDRGPGEWDSRLVWMWSSRTDGLANVERWAETQRRLVDSTVALIAATLPFLPETDWSVRAEIGPAGLSAPDGFPLDTPPKLLIDRVEIDPVLADPSSAPRIQAAADPGDSDASQQSVSVVPASVRGTDTTALLAALPEIIKAALADRSRTEKDAERDWIVVDARNGLVSGAKTFEELGYSALGVTRARVQQLEVRAISRLKEAVASGFVGVGYRLAPELEAALAAASSSIPPGGEGVFEDDLSTQLGVDPGRDTASSRRLAFLLRLAGGQRIGPDGDRRPAVWVAADESAARKSVALADRIARFLTESSGAPQSATDIVVALNKGRKSDLLGVREVQAAMPFCRAAEPVDDGRWQGRFSLLRGRGDQAFRLITEAGRPLDLDDMAREINARAGGRRLSARNLGNQLSADGRFVPIGKSGEWGLRAEHAADAAAIRVMMAEALRTAGRPLELEAIETAVAARRKVGEGSVGIYLSMRPEFTRLEDGTWALTEWPEAAGRAAAKPRRARVRRTPTQADRMEALLIPYLHSSPGGTRPLIDVVKYLSKALGIIPNTVYAYLPRIPTIERYEVDGKPLVRVKRPNAMPTDDIASRVRTLCAVGETPRVEFKSTLRWNVKAGIDDPSLQKMCTKTIAAFSNTHGGTLLIGVAPDGSIFGLEADCGVLQKAEDTCQDAFSRSLAAITAQHLGAGTAAQMVTHFCDVDGRTVCVVEVAAGRQPTYLRDGKTVEFYVRNGTTSRALDLSEVAAYIATRWL